MREHYTKQTWKKTLDHKNIQTNKEMLKFGFKTDFEKSNTSPM